VPSLSAYVTACSSDIARPESQAAQNAASPSPLRAAAISSWKWACCTRAGGMPALSQSAAARGERPGCTGPRPQPPRSWPPESAGGRYGRPEEVAALVAFHAVPMPRTNNGRRLADRRRSHDMSPARPRPIASSPPPSNWNQLIGIPRSSVGKKTSRTGPGAARWHLSAGSARSVQPARVVGGATQPVTLLLDAIDEASIWDRMLAGASISPITGQLGADNLRAMRLMEQSTAAGGSNSSRTIFVGKPEGSLCHFYVGKRAADILTRIPAKVQHGGSA
jgi:hypothetical protein